LEELSFFVWDFDAGAFWFPKEVVFRPKNPRIMINDQYQADRDVENMVFASNSTYSVYQLDMGQESWVGWLEAESLEP
jgi:hypothetical protein